MQRVILATLVFIFCLSWAEMKVEKVLETTSIKEYNQWVKKNRAKYPRLRPIFIQFSMEWKDKMRKYIIEYYSDNGAKLKEEKITDSLTYIGVSRENDRVFITKTGGYKSDDYQITAKDKHGNLLFSSSMPLDYTGIGDVYFASNLGEDAWADAETEVRVLNETGQEIGKLKGFGGIEGMSLRIPNDGRYAVFRGYRSHGIMPCIMINKKGDEVWRKELRGIRTIFISGDGSMIGINVDAKMIYVYKEDGSLFREYNPFNNKEYDLRNALSENGDWLSTGLHSRIKFYNNKTGNLIWQDDTTLATKNDSVKYVHIIGDGEKILILCRSHDLYVFSRHGKLLGSQNLNLGKSKVPKTIPTIDEKGRPTRKVVSEREVPFGYWKSEVIGDYLIITKEPEIPSYGTKGRMKIIYKINDD